MKIHITLKDPDGVGDSLDAAARASLPDLTDEEKEALYVIRRKKVGEDVRRWVEYEEYVSIEIDTETGTAIVLPVES